MRLLYTTVGLSRELRNNSLLFWSIVSSHSFSIKLVSWQSLQLVEKCLSGDSWDRECTTECMCYWFPCWNSPYVCLSIPTSTTSACSKGFHGSFFSTVSSLYSFIWHARPTVAVPHLSFNIHLFVHLHINIFILQILNEYPLCVRQCALHWGYNGAKKNSDTVPTFMELTVW